MRVTVRSFARNVNIGRENGEYSGLPPHALRGRLRAPESGGAEGGPGHGGSGRNPRLDLGELLGGEHRPQRRDRDLELVEVGLARRELLQPQARAASAPAPTRQSMCLAAKRMTS